MRECERHWVEVGVRIRVETTNVWGLAALEWRILEARGQGAGTGVRRDQHAGGCPAPTVHEVVQHKLGGAQRRASRVAATHAHSHSSREREGGASFAVAGVVREFQ